MSVVFGLGLIRASIKDGGSLMSLSNISVVLRAALVIACGLGETAELTD